MHRILRRLAPLVASAALVLTACTPGAARPETDPGTTPRPTAAASSATTATGFPSASAPPPSDVTAELSRLEARYDAVVGLYAVDTGTGTELTHRADRRFAYASTYKALAAGAVLERGGADTLEQVVTYDADDLVEYSPVTDQHVNTGMTMREVIEAAVAQSDNTAGNLLLDALGGPAGFQAALRAAGDRTTVAARYETELNDVAPGDDRDTSTARTLAGNLRSYALGDRLADDAREVLVGALESSTTGTETIRAGVPDGWVVGSKTGTSGNGTRNDIAVVRPPDGEPIVLAILTQTTDPAADPDDTLLAEVTALTIEALDG